jgi:TIGR03009 family protein
MTHRRILIAVTAATFAASCAYRAAGQETSPYAPVPGVAAATTPIVAPAAQFPQGGQVVGAPGQAVGLPGQGAVAGGAAPPAAAVPPAPPFQLSEIDQQFVRQTLEMWEGESAKINTFNAEFERWEYDKVFGRGFEQPFIKSSGTLSYAKPDRGSFKIEKINRWVKKNPQDTAANSPGEFVHMDKEIGEHWVCDGKAVYEYNHRDKQLVVNTIPEHMRGQEIVNGPLPFLFGAEADKLMARYWIRNKAGGAEEIWLEAFPRWQNDAANYDSVEVMLDRKTMQPKAIQVNLPGGQQRHVYIFTEAKVNQKNLGTWFNSLFKSPRVPMGYTRVVAEQAAPPQAAAQPGALQR